MKVRIKKISLSNFKGIQSFSADFSDVTRIYGDNATGKTTLVDAFTWLLFGKDSNDKKDFNIKNTVHTHLNRGDHEVTALLDIDGKETELKRVYREKWVKRRGSENEELQGHETLFFWNDVPLQAGEYQEKIDGLIKEQVFKMVTNPHYFNSMKWQDRRAMLVNMADNVTPSEVAGHDTEMNELISKLTDKTLDEYRKEIAAKKKKLKDELATIPARIDEVNRNTPQEQDWAAIQGEIDQLQVSVDELDARLQDQSKLSEGFFAEKTAIHGKINRCKMDISNIEFDARKKFNSFLSEREENINRLKAKIQSLDKQKETNEQEISLLKQKIASSQAEQARLREKWIQVNADKLDIDYDSMICPTCKQDLPSEMVHNKSVEMIENFNTDKARRLNEISTQGKAIVPLVNKLTEEIKYLEALDYEVKREELEKEVATWEGKKVASIQTMLADNKEYAILQEELIKLQKDAEKYEGEIPRNDNTHLKLRRTDLLMRIDNYKKVLNTREQIALSNERRDELMKLEKSYAQQLADYEKSEYTIQRYVRKMVDMMESKINAMFDAVVQFRLFDTQLNGGMVEVCETLVNRVPWPDANNAAKINAGISIINVISDSLNVYAPIWIDNSESITSIRKSSSQKIELYVSEKDKSLRIN